MRKVTTFLLDLKKRMLMEVYYLGSHNNYIQKNTNDLAT